MARVRLTRRYRFSAAHRLHSPLLGAEENRAVYGKCNNPHGHGHDYVVEVTAAGELDPQRGRLVRVDQLDDVVRRVLLDSFSHRNLNVEAAEFSSLVPTTENLALVAARRLAAAWPLAFPGQTVSFEKLKIWETRRNIFEVAKP
jgi:6-pyruvoyltetrahydropterin/6-carboxytetrahydropterin synthase